MATDISASGQDGSKAATHSENATTAILQDPVYEFSAPKFYDFATNSGDLPSTERADAWFDTAATSSKLCKIDERCAASCALLRNFIILHSLDKPSSAACGSDSRGGQSCR